MKNTKKIDRRMAMGLTLNKLKRVVRQENEIFLGQGQLTSPMHLNRENCLKCNLKRKMQ